MGRPRHSDSDPARATVRIGKDVAERLRVLAARQKRSTSSIVEEMVTMCLPAFEMAWKQRKSTPHKAAVPTKRLRYPATWDAKSIRAALANLGIPQYALASLLKVSAPTLSLWLGERGVPAHRQKDITKAITALEKRKQR